MGHRQVPTETILNLRQQLERLPPRCAERRHLIQQTAQLYDISESSVYRALRSVSQLHSWRRADYGQPRVMPKTTLERYCEVIAAIKLRTANRKERHLSTVEAIRLLEEVGVDTPDGFLQVPKDLLKRPTVNRYLKRWGYDHQTLKRQPPAVRFQARYSNDCWHFDLSPSDLKQVKTPAWIDPERGHPLLMIYSVVDDHRSGGN